MDNGAAVTKTSVDAVIKYIAERDQKTIEQIVGNAETNLYRLQNDSYHGTRIEQDNA